jgi:hypothetical protein
VAAEEDERELGSANGEERSRLELSARAEEDERELGSEGEWCGVLWGVELAFYRGRGGGNG